MREKNVKEYFRKLFSKKGEGKMGRMENPDIEIEGSICPKGTHRDQVFLYAKKEEGKIKEMKFMCAYCDPYMFVAADILCRIAEGKTKKEIEKIKNIDDYIGETNQTLYEHFERVKELFLKAMS